MNPANQFSWTLAHSGKVSVSHQRMRGIVMSKVHIQCDCTSDSMLSDIVLADIQGDFSIKKTWLDTELKRTKEIKEAAAAAMAAAAAATAAAAVDSSGRRTSYGGGRHSDNSGRKSGGKRRNIAVDEFPEVAVKRSEFLLKDKALVMRIKTAEVRDNKLVVTNGEITVQGETVIVKNGVPYFNGKSQLGLDSLAGPPVLTGSQVDIKRLEVLASKGGVRNLYFNNLELLDGGQRSVIRNPEIHFGDLVIPMESAISKQTTAELIDKETLQEILPNHEQVLADVEAIERQNMANRAAKHESHTPVDDSGELNQVVLINGRCVLKDSCVIVLRGVLHVGSAWHQVSNGLLGGSDKEANLHPVTFSGTPVYINEEQSSQILLDNVLLYSRGRTLYAGNTPLLTGAMLHADGTLLDVVDLRRSAVRGLVPPPDAEPARLFLQGGKFMVDEIGLTILEGTVWLKDLKLQLPEDSFDEVTIQDSVIFHNLETDKDGTPMATVFEGRDLIYKNKMLLLDDLTPLLNGGFICHGDKKQPLAWLSSDPNAIYQARQSEFISLASEEVEDRKNLLTEGTCIVEETGLYFIEGSMIVNGKKVLIDKGVPLFSSDSAVNRKSQNVAVQPPRLTGQVLPEAIKELRGTSINGRVVLKNVQLDIKDGRVMVNQRVPIMESCELKFDSRVFRAQALGVEPGSEPNEENIEFGFSPDGAESARAQEIGRSRGEPAGKGRNRTGGRPDFPSSDGYRASKDSGCGVSDPGLSDNVPSERLASRDGGRSGGASPYSAGGASPYGSGGASVDGASPYGAGGASPYGSGGASADGASPYGAGGASPYGSGGASVDGASVDGASPCGTGGASTGGTSPFGVGGATPHESGGASPYGAGGASASGASPYGAGCVSAGGASAGGVSAGGTSADGASAGGTSADGASAGGTSAGGTSAGGAYASGTPQHGASDASPYGAGGASPYGARGASSQGAGGASPYGAGGVTPYEVGGARGSESRHRGPGELDGAGTRRPPKSSMDQPGSGAAGEVDDEFGNGSEDDGDERASKEDDDGTDGGAVCKRSADGGGGQGASRDAEAGGGSDNGAPRPTGTSDRRGKGLVPGSRSRSHGPVPDRDRFTRKNPFLDDGRSRMMHRVAPSASVTELPTGENFKKMEVPSSGTGILGNFYVCATGERRLVFSLWTRIEESLRFLEMDV